MTRRFLLAGVLAGAAFGSALSAQAADWVKLYNGKDLSGWHVESGKLESWAAKGEMISCVKPGGGYLATDKEYGDFELKVDYRIPPAGNSGIGLRFPKGGWPSTDGMEIQILDDEHPMYKDLTSVHWNGSIYTHVAPKTRASKPVGQWNHYEIRCQGPRVVVKLNGTEVINANLDDYNDSLGKGKVALGKRPRKGLVGLQSHGDPVDFKNIEIREL
jgi:hypothetical protein